MAEIHRKKRQQMAPEAYTELGLIYLVRVEDATKDGKDVLNPKP